MAYNTKSIKKDVDGKPIPQYFNPTGDEYEALQGRNGANRIEIYGPDGDPVSVVSNKLAVRASEVETLLESLDGKDFATQATLAEVLAKLSDDPATQTTLAAILAKIIDAPATEAKQDTIIGHVDGIEGALTTLNSKDFATQTTLSQILAKIIAAPATEAKQDTLIGHVDGVESVLASILAKIIVAPATEAKQDALAALIGEVRASPTANTLLARLKSLEDKIAAIDSVLDAIVDGSTPAVTQLSGSNMELYGASINDRPAANTVPAGATFTIVDKDLDKNWISDGANWEEV